MSLQVDSLAQIQCGWGKAPNAADLVTTSGIKTLLVGGVQRDTISGQIVSFHQKKPGKPSRGQVTRGRGSRPAMLPRPTRMEEEPQRV